jgi:UDPglucose--hexose-1-phosphate uridylyltransferase
LKDYVEQELKWQERVVIENEHFVVLVPFWATWPYETMIISKRHFGNIIAMTNDETKAFSEILKELQLNMIIYLKHLSLFSRNSPISNG